MRPLINKYILTALLLVILNPCFAQKKYSVLGVAFYNCENYFNPANNPEKDDDEFTPDGSYHYTNEIYQQKQHNLARVFEALGKETTPDGPAIIGLAEIEDDQVLKDLVAQPAIKSRGYRYIWFYGPDERGITTGMLYNPKYFKVLQAWPINVPLKGRPTRDILHVYGILGGDTVHVLVNHWPSRSGGEAASAPGRMLAAGVDKKLIDSLQKINPETKIILMGDLNDDPTNLSVIKVLQAKANKADLKMTDLYNPWINLHNKGLGSLAYNDSWNLFDQIMISGSLTSKNDHHWYYYKSEIFNKDFLVEKFGQYKGYPFRSYAGTRWQNGYSDHFPVIMYFIKASE